MSYLVLARKYRPQIFAEVVKQDHVTQTLANTISADRVAHAILFTGPRGTGKTTIARILAKALNCEKGPLPEPCNKCQSCIEITSGSAADVFEIDGASNNSVEQIRELRGNINYMPVRSRYKIYIIDEVHMLTIAAFNALLKTLEEPPPHIMFLFATTAPDKIPITILSRCQRHDLRRISSKAIISHLQKLCDKEGIKVGLESLGLIAGEAGGSMRDALSLLDQIISSSFSEKVEHNRVLDILGGIDRKILHDISAAVFSGEVAKILKVFDEIYSHGRDMKKLYNELVLHFRNLLIIKMGRQASKVVDLPQNEIKLLEKQVEKVSELFLSQIYDLIFKQEAAIKFSAQPRLVLEMIFIKFFQIKPALPIETLIEKIDSLKKITKEDGFKQVVKKDSEYDIKPAEPLNKRMNKRIDPDLNSEPDHKPDHKTGTADYSEDLKKDFPKDAPFDKVRQRLIELITLKKPSIGAHLRKCEFKTLNRDKVEIEVSSNGFALKAIKNSIGQIKQVAGEIFGNTPEVILLENIAAKDAIKNSQEKIRHEKIKQDIMKNPLILDALEIFNGTIIDIKLLEGV